MAMYALSIGGLPTYCAALRAKSYKKAAHSAAFLLLCLTFVLDSAILYVGRRAYRSICKSLHALSMFNGLTTS